MSTATLAVIHTTTFDAAPAQVAAARSWAIAASGLHGEAAHDLALIVSELATNACTHSRSARPDGTYVLTLTRHDDRVRIDVADPGPLRPAIPRPAGVDDESGRGLTLVAAFAHDWGVEPHCAGTRVWAEIRTDTAPGC